MSNFAMILVGGQGTRLWPMSRKNYPKQFVEFQDGLSLFQLTIKRLLGSFDSAAISIVSGAAYKFTIENQIDMMAEFDARTRKNLKKNLVLEPEAKNTLPAIMLGVKFLQERCKMTSEDFVYVFPSDHIISPEAKFRSSLKKAAKAAANDKLVVFGIKPDCPKEGYGYILPELENPKSNQKENSFIVKKFVEKPSKKKAEELIANGGMWNAGIFCFKNSVFCEELEKHQPELFSFYEGTYGELLVNFSKCAKDSIDYGIMQKTERAAVVTFDPRWSDLGSWDSLLEFYSDGKSNFNVGKVELLDCEDCLVYSKDRLVSMVGLKDLIVVDSPDALLVMKKGDSDKVKQVVERLDKKKAPEAENSPTVYRPWGYYTILEDRQGYKVKEIGVYPGRAISLQKHKHRSEHWNIVEGKAYIIIGNQRMEVSKNQSVYVPKNTKHKVYNHTKKTVKIIEVQIGNYLEEDDIIRYDRYE